jgi:predicted ribosomally synthesized peptide with nif11-like leader
MGALSCDEAGLFSSCSLDGGLSKDETKLLSAHLAQCGHCRARMEAMAAVDTLAGELNRLYQGVSLDSAFVQKVEAAVRATPEYRWRRASAEGRPEDDLRRFNRRVANDAVLRQKLKTAASLESFMNLYVQLGGEQGFRFTDMDLKRLMGAAANDKELSDVELDAVVGGTDSIEQFLNDLLKF